MKLKKKDIHQRMFNFLLTAIFLYEYGSERSSWEYLFLIEQYKDLLKEIKCR